MATANGPCQRAHALNHGLSTPQSARISLGLYEKIVAVAASFVSPIRDIAPQFYPSSVTTRVPIQFEIHPENQARQQWPFKSIFPLRLCFSSSASDSTVYRAVFFSPTNGAGATGQVKTEQPTLIRLPKPKSNPAGPRSDNSPAAQIGFNFFDLRPANGGE